MERIGVYLWDCVPDQGEHYIKTIMRRNIFVQLKRYFKIVDTLSGI